MSVPRYLFRWAVLDVESPLRENAYAPTVVWVGGNPYPPASCLVALAHVAGGLLDGHPVPSEVPLDPAHLGAAKYVASDSAQVWDWPVFRPGFDWKHLPDLVRLQMWTLKSGQLETARHPSANTALQVK